MVIFLTSHYNFYDMINDKDFNMKSHKSCTFHPHSWKLGVSFSISIAFFPFRTLILNSQFFPENSHSHSRLSNIFFRSLIHDLDSQQTYSHRSLNWYSLSYTLDVHDQLPSYLATLDGLSPSDWRLDSCSGCISCDSPLVLQSAGLWQGSESKVFLCRLEK